MAYSLTQFANSPGPDQLAALDNNFVTLSVADPISCVIAGTNTLTLTQNAAGLVPSTTIAAYSQNLLFTGIATATNTNAVTAAAGSLPALNVYKDSSAGPVLLSGNEIILNNAISLLYDGALNSGAGGFHLISSTASVSTAISPTSVQIDGQSTLTNLLSGTASLTFTATPGWTAQDQTFTLTGLPPAVPAVGDFVQISPPSLAAAGVVFQGMVTALGSLSSVASVATVNVRLNNAASASLASNSGIYRYVASRYVP